MENAIVGDPCRWRHWTRIQWCRRVRVLLVGCADELVDGGSVACVHTVRSLSQGRDADGTIAEFLATNGLAEPDNKIAAIPWVKVWGAWDTMLQEPWDKVAAYANPRQSVSSNLIKLSTYHSWFMTGDIPQEELEAGYPQGINAKVYQAHIRYPVYLCETVNAVSYWCTPSCY